MNTRAPALQLGALDDADLAQALRHLGLHLRVEEVRRLLGRLEREPTLAELALLDSMWSEHCSYKSSRALLRLLPTQGPQVVLGPGADAGVVRLPRRSENGSLELRGATHCLALGHESHNHPSQLLPFEGASTGIGGIVRDVYCMGAEVIGVLDALRFGDPDGPQAEVVRQIVRGVVAGIAHYGNALGVPNLGGEVEFDGAFDDNCLVNVVALGSMEESDLVPSRAPAVAGEADYVLLLVGKPTDDSGLGGAAFASGILDTDEATQERGAVQLPDPFFKRVLSEANRAALALLRQSGRPFAMKDLGAAGLGGAATEIAGSLGLVLDLDAVHRDQPERSAAVLLVAETQERYVFAVPASLATELRRLYEEDFELGRMVRGAGARVIGRFDSSGRVRVLQHGLVHVDLPTEWVTQAEEMHWPRTARRATPPRPADLRGLLRRDLEKDLRAVLGSRAGGSRWPLFAHYDSDVQGHTAFRPGDADAGLLVPWRDEELAVAVAVAGPARRGSRDAYLAAQATVCEAVRNVVAVGATPWALTDCLNFGSPENPECMHELEETVRGLADAADALGCRGFPLPFVSGNVSLYNESRAGRAIPPTPIVACVGVALEVGRCRGMALKEAGEVLLRLGAQSSALGGSLYAAVTEQQELFLSAPPSLDLEAEKRSAEAVLAAYDAGALHACRDLGAGGVLLALLEMSFGRRGQPRLGLRLHLGADALPVPARLFGEAPGYVCAVPRRELDGFERLCAAHGVPCQHLGEVLDRPELELQAEGTDLRLPLAPLAHLWLQALQDVLLEEVAR